MTPERSSYTSYREAGYLAMVEHASSAKTSGSNHFKSETRMLPSHCNAFKWQVPPGRAKADGWQASGGQRRLGTYPSEHITLRPHCKRADI